jgi:hypothetical protein
MFTEKPAIEFPEQLWTLGFEDRSYRNDGAALALLKVTNAGAIARDIKYVGVWCSEERPEDRADEDMTRYCVIFMEHADDVADSHEAYNGESIDECIAEIQRLIRWP